LLQLGVVANETLQLVRTSHCIVLTLPCMSVHLPLWVLIVVRVHFLLQTLIFFEQLTVVLVQLMKLRDIGRLNVSLSCLEHLILFEVLKMRVRCRCRMSRELLLELIGIQIELLNHLVDVFNVVFEVVFRVFDSLVPQHCEVPLDVGLSDRCVGHHLKVGSSHLSCKNEGLALHQ